MKININIYIYMYAINNIFFCNMITTSYKTDTANGNAK